MNARMRRLEAITRRDALLGLAAAGGGLMRPGDAFAQAAQPWSMAPRSKVDKLNFVVWTYGDIYARIARQFEADWGVKVESTISSFNDHPTKLATMFAGGEKIDVSQSSPFSFPNFISQGLVEPLDGLPAPPTTSRTYSGFTKQVAVVDGKLMGLPYFAAIWVWNYNDDMLEKPKIARPFSTYEEFIEHCLKAKKDGVSPLPGAVGRRRRPRAAPGHLVPDDLEPRRRCSSTSRATISSAPARSRARRLKWWANTFEKGLDIADPESLKVQFTDLGEGVRRRQEPLSRSEPPLRAECRQRSRRSRSIAGKVKVHGFAGRREDDRRSRMSISCQARNRDKEWAWKLLQYLGGKTKDGEYTQAVNLAKDAMLGSGYNSVMQSDAVKTGGRRGAMSMPSSRCGTRRPTSAPSCPRSTSPGTSPGPISSTSRSRSA